MKIVADENIEREIVISLRQTGHNVVDIKETQPGIDDEAVLAVAIAEGALLVTNDKDFGELVYRDQRFSGGLILLRFGKLEISQRAGLLRRVLEEHGQDLIGAFTVITSTSVRIRK